MAVEVNETTHFVLCHAKTYGRKSLRNTHLSYSGAGHEYDSLNIRVARRYKKDVILEINKVFTMKVPIYIWKNYVWLLKADFANAKQKEREAIAKKQEAEELKELKHKKDIQLIQYMKAYIGQFPNNYELELQVKNGILLRMNVRELVEQAEGSAGSRWMYNLTILCFRKYYGHSVEKLLESEEFKKDVFVKLPQLLELHRALCVKN
jgi:hypothetical protein